MAAYLRFSSENQDETSLEDQLRRCREVAARDGFTIPSEFVFTDRAISGRSMKNRPGLQRLLAAAKLSPSPFQGVIIFDTARLARNVEELLRVYKILKHRQIFLHVATSGLDSRMPMFDFVLMMMGSMDEKFVDTLAENIFKGQEGAAKRGFNPGGTRYGYRNVPEEHPTEIGLHGRLKVLGVHEVKVPEKAEVVLLIFSLYAAGWGIDRIAKHLNVNGVVAPGKPRKNLVPSWAPFTIRGILRNQIYIGKRVWGKFKKVKDPETDRIEMQKRPEDQWTVYEDDKLKIVPSDLWEKVQARIRQVEKKRGPRVTGGMSRTENSRQYIFSDTLYCSCKAKMIAGSGPPERVRYVCSLHRRGKCLNGNGLTIPRSSLERQLMDRIVQTLQFEEFVHLMQEEFERQVAIAVQVEAIKAATVRERREDFRQEHASLVRKIDFYDVEIGNGFGSETVRAKLRKCVSRKEEIEEMLEAEARSSVPEIDRAEIRAFFQANFNRLADVLLADPVSAKQEILNRVDKLVLTPEVRDGEQLYVVTGDLRLFSGDSDVLLRKPLEGYREQYIGLRLSLDGWVLNTQTQKNKVVKEPKRELRKDVGFIEGHRQEFGTDPVLPELLADELNSDDAGEGGNVNTMAIGEYEYRNGFGGLRLAAASQPPRSASSIDTAIP
ncbi:MAG: recombinase family protein [Terracidiphilus sp.]